jgi:PDZ domain-containing secreted protein
MKKGKNRVLHVIPIVISVLLVLAIIYVVYLELKPRVAEAVTMEAGEPMVDIKKFLLERNSSGSFITDINQLDPNVPGVYEVKIKVRHRIYNSKLIIADTTAPAATVVNPLVLMNEEVKAQDFVKDIKDATEVKLSLKEEPDTSFPG